MYSFNNSPDNTFEVLINGESEKKGSLLEDFEPAVNPAKEIDDADDFKPEDWVDEATIADPEAKKVIDIRINNERTVCSISFSPRTGTRTRPSRSSMKRPLNLKDGWMMSP